MERERIARTAGAGYRLAAPALRARQRQAGQQASLDFSATAWDSPEGWAGDMPVEAAENDRLWPRSVGGLARLPWHDCLAVLRQGTVIGLMGAAGFGLVLYTAKPQPAEKGHVVARVAPEQVAAQVPEQPEQQPEQQPERVLAHVPEQPPGQLAQQAAPTAVSAEAATLPATVAAEPALTAAASASQPPAASIVTAQVPDAPPMRVAPSLRAEATPAAKSTQGVSNAANPAASDVPASFPTAAAAAATPTTAAAAAREWGTKDPAFKAAPGRKVLVRNIAPPASATRPATNTRPRQMRPAEHSGAVQLAFARAKRQVSHRLESAAAALPGWLTESRSRRPTALVMSEPPHSLTLPPGMAHMAAAIPPAAAPAWGLPPLRTPAMARYAAASPPYPAPSMYTPPPSSVYYGGSGYMPPPMPNWGSQ